MPQSLRDVIAATDFSAGAEAAVQRAAIQAAELQAGLTLVHVFERDALAVLRDLIQGRSLLGQTLLGGVTAWALEHAACDVLVVPAAAVASRP